MAKDKKDKTPKKYNLRKRSKKNYKINNSDSSDDSDWDESEETETERALEFQKFLQKLFPSKNQDEKVRQLQNIKKMINKEDLKQEKKESDVDTYYMDEAGEEVSLDPQNMKFNIVFTVADNDINEEDYDDEWDREYEKAMLKEKKEKKIKKKKFKKNENIIVKLEEWEKSYKGKITKVYKKGNYYDVLLNDNELDKRKWKKVHSKYLSELKEDDYLETLNEMKKLTKLKKNKGNKAMMKKLDKFSKIYDEKMKKKKKEEEKKQKNENTKDFRKLLREKSVSNDFTYFKKISMKEQKNILEKLKKIKEYSNVEKPYRLSLIESEIPVEFKSNALKKINMLNYMDPSSGEYYKVKQWVDTFMRIPFNKNKKLSLTIDDDKDLINNFMESAKKTLDEAVYGLDDAKMQIMQMVGQLISNPNSVGSAIAIVGPPGTGKTTLVKQGISKILQRPYAFMALGGATDSSFLEGHSYTYEGSSWGKIVDILIQSKCMNPLIYFDELDKISQTPKGEEITGILTHLTDTSQNDKFHDKYFSSIDFDLSKCLFIFSYNDESKVNPILKDRMYRITTKGYDKKEKTKIALDYLIPDILKNVNFKKGQIIIPEETIHHLVDNLTDKEKGVRNLKRCIEIIYTKLNLFRLMKPDTKLFEKEKTMKVEFPFTVDIETVKKLIKKVDTNGPPLGMYI